MLRLFTAAVDSEQLKSFLRNVRLTRWQKSAFWKPLNPLNISQVSNCVWILLGSSWAHSPLGSAAGKLRRRQALLTMCIKCKKNVALEGSQFVSGTSEQRNSAGFLHKRASDLEIYGVSFLNQRSNVKVTHHLALEQTHTSPSGMWLSHTGQSDPDPRNHMRKIRKNKLPPGWFVSLWVGRAQITVSSIFCSSCQLGSSWAM